MRSDLEGQNNLRIDSDEDEYDDDDPNNRHGFDEKMDLLHNRDTNSPTGNINRTTYGGSNTYTPHNNEATDSDQSDEKPR